MKFLCGQDADAKLLMQLPLERLARPLGTLQAKAGSARDVLRSAQQILFDGSFDISQPIAEVMGPFEKQLIVSRDFVERRENCRINKIYAAGGAAGAAVRSSSSDSP